jgi:hypothetical protein
MQVKFNVIIYSFLLFCHLLSPSYAGDVLFIDVSPPSSDAGQKLQLACKFYGLGFEQVIINHTQPVSSFEQKESRAIAITGQALPGVDVARLISLLKINRGKRLPLLILGITPETNMSLLTTWSDGAVAGCTRSKIVPFDGFYKVADMKPVARQLAGQEIPVNTESLNYLILDESRNTLSIISVKSSTGETLFPVFVRTVVDGQEVFFQTQSQFSGSSAQSIGQIDKERFLEIAPLMMFLWYACGERCWHSHGYYANLTIDDPCLREPYGLLSYRELLKEMQKANFHTTIALIPWYFDCSEPQVVSLFREHAKRFSICIHGNNHDGYEFYKYETEVEDPWPAKPLDLQEANIKQALARMGEFKRLTGLPWDRIMVFPHGIAPAKTLGLLKKYNFLATSNARNVPLGSDEPNDVLFRLKPLTLSFENFASLRRNAAKGRTKADIAIDLFLGNPILLYGHHNLFQGGIDSFNRIADVVNNTEPSVKWQSLGFIARHLYLKRIRDDGNYDVRAFCRSIELENTQKHDLIYFVRKEESFSPPVRQVTVDGELYPYKKSGGDLSLTIAIPASESRLVNIEYENRLNLTSFDISKNDPCVNRLRWPANFRDRTLSKYGLARGFIKAYYKTGLYKLGVKRAAVTCFVLSFVLAVVMYSGGRYLLRRTRRRHHPQRD